MPVKVVVTALLVALGTSLFLPVPQNLMTWFENGQSYYKIGEYEYATKEYSKIIRFRHWGVEVQKVEVGITEEFELPIKAAAFYQLGSCHKKLEDFDKAAEQYQMVLKQANVPEDFRATVQFQIAETRFYQQKFLEATEEYQNFIAQYPQSRFVDKAYFRTGVSFYKAEKYEKAISVFGELTSKFPESNYAADAAYQVADCYAKLNEYEESIAAANNVLEKYPHSATVAKAEYLKAFCYDKLGDYDRTIESYKKIIALYDKMYEILRASFREGKNVDFDEYIRFYENSFMRIGEIYRDRMGDHEKAYDAYVLAQETVEERDYKAKIQLDIGHNYLRWRKYDEAIKAYSLVITNYPKSPYPPDAQASIGDAYYQTGDLDKAKEEYLNVLIKFPDCSTERRARALYDAGWCSEQLNQFQEALAYYNRAVEEFSHSQSAPPSLVRIGQIFYNEGRYEEAIAEYDKIFERYPENELANQVHYSVGQSLVKLGRTTEAREAFGKVTKEAGKFYVAASIASADLYFQTGDETAAQRILTELLTATSGDKELEATAHFETAKLYQKNKEYSQAVGEYTIVIQNFPQEEFINDAYFGRGASYHALASFSKAEVDYEFVLNNRPSDQLRLKTQFAVGLLFSAMGRDAEAVDILKIVVRGEDKELAANARIQLISLAEKESPERAIPIYEEILQTAETDHERALILTRLANVYYKLKLYDQCISAAEKVIQIGETPEGIASAYYIQANCYFDAKDFQKAIEQYRIVTDKYPETLIASNALFQIGLSCHQLGTIETIDGSVEAFTRFYKLYPENPAAPAAYYYAAWGFYRKGEWESATDVFKSLADRYPSSEFAVEGRYRQGESLFNKKLYENAMAVFERVLKEHPQCEYVDDALYSKAWCLIYLDRKDEAVPIFREIVAKFGDTILAPNSQFSIGDYFYSVENYEQATIEYKRFLGFFPDHEKVARANYLLENLAEINAYNVYHRGELLFDEGNYGKSIAVFDSVMVRFPESEYAISALVNMGAAYEAKEDFDRAREKYSEVITRYGSDFKYSAQVEFCKSHLEVLKTAL
ncbi:MAG: tetratricopeptide repeat protein [Candidatus Latescibacteria bacterium]|nr:tetratricopeptide repeat protein [Candidatus Latescibacterota bacterium]